MKRCIITILFSISMLPYAYSQISSYTPNKKSYSDTESIAVYDSTKFQWGDNALKSFVGQQFIGFCTSTDKKFGYVSIELFTKKNDSNKRYMPTSNGLYTRCEAIEGKTFTVIDTDEDSINKWFLLQDNNNPKLKLWYKWSGVLNGPFIVVSNYNYLCDKYIGMKFRPILKHKPDVAQETFFVNDTDLESGEKIPFDPTDIWECISFSQLEGKGEIVSIVKNQKGNISYISIPRLIPNEYYGSLLGKKSTQKMVLFEEEFATLADKYGLLTMARFMTGNIDKGMNIELLYLMKGKPKTINRSTFSDSQFVYEFVLSYFGSDAQYHKKKVTQYYYVDEATGEIKDWSQLN